MTHYWWRPRRPGPLACWPCEGSGRVTEEVSPYAVSVRDCLDCEGTGIAVELGVAG